MQTVNLVIKEDDGVKTIKHDVEEMNILQYTRAIKILKEIIDTAKDNENLQAVVQDALTVAEQNQDQEATQVAMMAMKRLLGASDVLLVELPESFLNLISAVSNINKDVLMNQKPETLFDIYDAVIEVNDLEVVIDRAKKSFNLTKSQLAGIQILAQKANDQMQQ